MGERSDYVNWSIATVIGRKQKRKTDNSCWCAVAWSVITQWTVLEAWFAQRFIFPPFFSRFLFVYFFFSSITSSAWLVDSIISFIFARRKWEFIPHFLRLHFLVENTLEMACDDFIDYDIELAIRLSALEYAFAYLVWLKPCTSGECTHTHTQWVINQDVIYNTSVHASAKCQQRPRLITWQQWRRRQSPLLRCERKWTRDDGDNDAHCERLVLHRNIL